MELLREVVVLCLHFHNQRLAVPCFGQGAFYTYVSLPIAESLSKSSCHMGDELLLRLALYEQSTISIGDHVHLLQDSARLQIGRG